MWGGNGFEHILQSDTVHGRSLFESKLYSLGICGVLLLQPRIEHITVPQAKCSPARLFLLNIGNGFRLSHDFNEANAVPSGETAIGEESEIKTLLLPDIVHYIDNLQGQHILTKI